MAKNGRISFMKPASFQWRKVIFTAVSASLIIGFFSYAGYRYWSLRQEDSSLKADSIELRKQVTGLEAALSSMRNDLIATQSGNTALSQNLQAAQNENDAIVGQINQLSGTVGDLQKLSTIDPQLLEKYSKVYFLSENYAPTSLSAIDTQYLFDKSKAELILAGVLPRLEALLAAAGRDGVALQIVSAYRSFYEQASLKFGYKITYGAGTANQFSAEQGYSEHQLGTAVDFTTQQIGAAFSKFDGTDGFQWLTNNAYKYGFVLSYPKNNTYYIYEPWHWRYVGVALAAKLHDSNQYFYNLSQREIDSYLISFFD